MTEESPVINKCRVCGQIMQKSYRGQITGESWKDLWACMNSKCPEYFEPALRQKKAKRPPTYCQVEGCDLMQEYGDGIWACRVHQPELFENENVEWKGDNRMTYGPDIGRAPGVKLDGGKPPVFTEFLMQFPRAIRMITRVGAKGTEAPGHVRSGWKAVPQGYLRYSDAQARHLLDEAILGAEAHLMDETSELSDPVEDLIWQAATVAWNDLARLELLIRENRAAAERLDPRAAP